MSGFITSLCNLNVQVCANMPLYKGFIINETSLLPKVLCRCYEVGLCIMSTESAQSGENPADHAAKSTKRKP